MSQQKPEPPPAGPPAEDGRHPLVVQHARSTLPACRGSHEATPLAPAAGDGRGRWIAVGSVAAASFALVLSQFVMVAVLPDVMEQFDVSAGTAGLTLVLPGLLAAVAAPVLTLAFGQLDRRVVLWGLTAIIALSDVIAALAPNFGTLMVARLVLGGAIGAFWTMGVGVGRRLVAPAQVTRATSLVMAGISAGTVVSLPLGNLVAQYWDWRSALAATSVLSVSVLLVQLRVLPKMPAAGALHIGDVFGLLRSPKARVGLLLSALLFFAHFGAYTFVSSFLTEQAGFSTTTVGGLLLLYGVAGFIGNFAAGATLDHSIPATLGTAAAVLAASVLVLGQWHSQPAAAVALFLWGISFGAIPISLQTYMMRGTTAEAGLALFVTVSQLSLATGSFVGGMFVDRFGLPTDYTLFAVPAVIAVLIAATRLRHHTQGWAVSRPDV
ncbi:MFS transporter [Streptomyces fulvorobeus]|uniref:MFS transporter n=1 Tax=Streptomyces fulvorobeus TaxID=284028 RepID=A0A7J0CG04_9ACTN|nr:MFS transporter [Streptomyces fulvorobeus]NYE44640.1 putative MFS family arabinose efflux permease [Streptomyces fulvorobeus]GFN01188.1 MFS transporter [Streptomyces fulvorobeus]